MTEAVATADHTWVARVLLPVDVDTARTIQRTGKMQLAAGLQIPIDNITCRACGVARAEAGGTFCEKPSA